MLKSIYIKCRCYSNSSKDQNKTLKNELDKLLFDHMYEQDQILFIRKIALGYTAECKNH